WPAVAALAALVVFVAGLGFGLVSWQWLRAETANQALADKARELEIKHYVRNIALAERELATGDIGRAEELLEECPERLRGWDWHYLQRRRYVEPPMLSLGGRAVDLAFSPDGQLLAAAGGKEVKVWEPATGREVFSLPGHADVVVRVCFSPDGRRLASAGR